MGYKGETRMGNFQCQTKLNQKVDEVLSIETDAKDTTLAKWFSCRDSRYHYGGRDLPSNRGSRTTAFLT